MLSKCANYECSESFRYLHAGKIFCHAPTPDLQILMGMPEETISTTEGTKYHEGLRGLWSFLRGTRCPSWLRSSN